MLAADYFMSARARGLQPPPGLDSLGTATIRHLTWRFGCFYRDERMMRIMVGYVRLVFFFVTLKNKRHGTTWHDTARHLTQLTQLRDREYR